MSYLYSESYSHRLTVKPFDKINRRPKLSTVKFTFYMYLVEVDLGQCYAGQSPSNPTVQYNMQTLEATTLRLNSMNCKSFMSKYLRTLSCIYECSGN